jgi:hypothetical protein
LISRIATSALSTLLLDSRPLNTQPNPARATTALFVLVPSLLLLLLALLLLLLMPPPQPPLAAAVTVPDEKGTSGVEPVYQRSACLISSTRRRNKLSSSKVSSKNSRLMRGWRGLLLPLSAASRRSSCQTPKTTQTPSFCENIDVGVGVGVGGGGGVHHDGVS